LDSKQPDAHLVVRAGRLIRVAIGRVIRGAIQGTLVRRARCDRRGCTSTSRFAIAGRTMAD